MNASINVPIGIHAPSALDVPTRAFWSRAVRTASGSRPWWSGPWLLLQRLVSLALGTVLLVGLGALLLICQPQAAAAAAPTAAPEAAAGVAPAELAKAVAEMEQLDQLRVSLASTLEGRTEEPTQQTMKEVCKPVGMRAVAIGKENGWSVRQVASKYRNPDHAPASAQERQVLDLFARYPQIGGLWEPSPAAEAAADQAGTQGAGLNYYRRINIEASCLACHGSRDSRPAFVKEGYPQDRAYDFKVGDLRGMYAVHIPVASPELQQALLQAR